MSRIGWLLTAVLAECCFGLSGTFATPLFAAGWTPGAASIVRSAVGATVLAVPTLLAMRGHWARLRRAWPSVVAFGAIGIAGSQGGYFLAASRIPVSTALMIEYLAPVLLVVVAAVAARRPPARRVIAGSLVAMAGLLAVLGPSGRAMDPVGLTAAALSAVACATYFALAASIDLPPIALAGFGFAGATVTTALLGAVGVLPMRAGAWQVRLLGAETSALVPLAVVTVVATLTAYGLSVTSAPHIGSRAASFVGLVEVLAATAAAALVLGQVPGPLQLGGGAVLLAGVGLVLSAQTGNAAAPVPDGPAAHATLRSPARRPSRARNRAPRAAHSRST